MPKKSAATARAVRKEIGDMGFPFWVRCYSDGSMWVGPTEGSTARRELLRMRLVALGYPAICIGAKGTSGEYIIDVPASPEACPICLADCAGANPQPLYCPNQS